MITWLSHELAHVRVLGHRLAVRRVHLTTLIVLVLLAGLLGLIVGFGAGYRYPYRTLPRPPLTPGQAAPGPACPHVMGGCLPRPKAVNAALITATSQGPDLSNNDPVGEPGQSAIAAHNAFEIDKVSESTGFIDSTAPWMIADAQRHRLSTGGYDFLHVCLTDPAGEARVFVAAERAAGLLHPNTLPGTGDAEYPPSPQCNVRVWIGAWVATVHALTGRWPEIYTGAWWWNPHVGAWWPAHALAWISGYTGSLSTVPRPGGRSHIDLWQFTDSGWNGATVSDLSIWLDGAAAFRIATNTPAPNPCGVLLTARFTFYGEHAAECSTVHTWYRFHCREPARRGVCVSSRRHLIWLVGRLWRVARENHICVSVSTCAPINWRYAHRGVRLQLLEKPVGDWTARP